MGQEELSSMYKVLRVSKHQKIRKQVFGTTKKPRLSVFRSDQHIYAQIIDDSVSQTLVSASDIGEKGLKKEKAYQVGLKLAQIALKKKINNVVFDRGGFLYQGRVEQLAKGAREGGLKF